jgi:hypothetical protein
LPSTFYEPAPSGLGALAENPHGRQGAGSSGDRASGVSRGGTTSNRLPLSGVELTRICPPNSWASRRVMVSPQPDARDALARGHPLEFLKDPFQVLRGDPHPVVLDGQAPAAFGRHLEGDPNPGTRALLPAVLQRIDDESGRIPGGLQATADK